jgi:cell division protein FtsQ
LTTLPEWQLYNPSQIDVEGNRLLSKETIRKLVPIQYPQSIFQVQPQTIATKLVSAAPLQSVVVSRTVFPSRLTIQVRERLPVANVVRNGVVGFLDAEGVWMPQQAYPPSIDKPPLTVLEPAGRKLSQWTSLYRQISQSQIKISQIDARDESNLVLSTELGLVHFGSYNKDLFVKQLETLDRLRVLPEKLKSKNFAYIDLTDPTAPVLEMQTTAKESPKDKQPTDLKP